MAHGSVCVCACVEERERELDRESEKSREKERERDEEREKDGERQTMGQKERKKRRDGDTRCVESHNVRRYFSANSAIPYSARKSNATPAKSNQDHQQRHA